MNRAWWGLALFAVLAAAWATRYQPIIAEGVPMAWDRWGHRFCVPEHGKWRCGIRVGFP